VEIERSYGKPSHFDMDDAFCAPPKHLNPHPMKTLFIGSTKRGYLTLKAMLEKKIHVVGIINLEQDKHEVERYEAPIREFAAMHKVPLWETKRMKDRDYAGIIRKELKPDIALVVGCRIFLPAEVYTIPPRGTLAVHDSYLPEYRGFAPLNWSIINGENLTGVSLFQLSEETDGGDIVARKKIPFGKDETAIQVYERVITETVDIVLKAWPLLEKNKARRLKQDYQTGSITCSRTPSDGRIDWTKSTKEIYDLVRALTLPYPGAYTFFGNKKLMVWGAKPGPKKPVYVGRISGRVVGMSAEYGYIDVLTRDGVLRITEVQIEGTETSQPASQVIKSVKATLGLNSIGLLEEIRHLSALVQPKVPAHRPIRR
jgi:methionyl-tRNA formyltransferase